MLTLDAKRVVKGIVYHLIDFGYADSASKISEDAAIDFLGDFTVSVDREYWRELKNVDRLTLLSQVASDLTAYVRSRKVFFRATLNNEQSKGAKE